MIDHLFLFDYDNIPSSVIQLVNATGQQKDYMTFTDKYNVFENYVQINTYMDYYH